MPYLLCDVCETKLCSAYEFKQQCEKSDMTLREITNQSGSKSNKEEDIVIQPDVHEGLFEEVNTSVLNQYFLKIVFCFFFQRRMRMIYPYQKGNVAYLQTN